MAYVGVWINHIDEGPMRLNGTTWESVMIVIAAAYGSGEDRTNGPDICLVLPGLVISALAEVNLPLAGLEDSFS